VPRLIDLFARRYGGQQGYWEGQASPGAILTTTYGSPDREQTLPHLAAYFNRAYQTNGVVFAATLARLSLFSQARFAYQDLSDEHLWGANEVDGRKVTGLRRLERPWLNGTTGELLARMIQDVDCVGNAYIWDSAGPLVRLRPDQVTIVSHEVGDGQGRTYREVVGYWWDPKQTGTDKPSKDAQYFTVDEVAHWCADEETEILTADGWKDYRSLSTADEVLTLNHETGLSEWQPVLDVMVFPAQRREMVSMEGGEFSSLTTPNHRWPVEYRISRAKTYGRRWVTSDTIGAGDRIPIAAYSADISQEQKWSDALVEIVAWFWTEGRFRSGSRPGLNGRGIQVAQSSKNADNVARIRAGLTALFGAPVDRMAKRGPRSDLPPCWRESVDDDMIIFSLSANASDVVTAHAPGKVVTTEFIRSLTASQLDLFIKVSLLADNNGPSRLAQKSKAMAEQFALACILAGHAVSIREGCEKKRGYRMTNVRMMRKRHVYPQESKREAATFRVQRVAYDGHVWCPRTANQTWLARRNGSVYFTGNSPYPDPMANFRGMSWMTPIIREVQADTALTEYKIKYLSNAATPNMIVKYKQKLMPDTIDSIRERMAARYGGVDNAFKTLILDQGADHTVVGNSLEQMNYTTVQAAGENRILMAAGVPGIVVGAKEGLTAATYSNFKQAMRRFSDLTMWQLWPSVCSCLASIVDVPSGNRLWMRTSDIPALQEDEKERADTTLVKASAVAELSRYNWDPESIKLTVQSGDFSLLTHHEPMLNILSAIPKATPQAEHVGDPASSLNGKAPAELPPGASNGAARYDTSPIGEKKNWVTDVGGLPEFIRAIAHALIRDGHSESEAIQMAVGVVKNWASGQGHVKPETRAKAAAAVAEWESKKAASHAT
jgi:hypothetical protein